MTRRFTKYPKQSINASSMGYEYDVIHQYLSDDEIYNTLNSFEKRILAKAANNLDYRVYLLGAIDALDLAGVSTSDTFNKVAEMLIENWQFNRGA